MYSLYSRSVVCRTLIYSYFNTINAFALFNEQTKFPTNQEQKYNVNK